MIETIPFLKELLTLPGLSGHEDPAARIIEKVWRTLVDEVSRSRLGSVHAYKTGSGKSPRPSILIATHMDAIGLMVTGVEDGFLHVSAVGGVDARVLPGTLVTVHATGSGAPKDLPAVIAQPPSRLLPPELGNDTVPLQYLLVDTGLPPKQVSGIVQIGDLVSYASLPVEHAEEYISGHTLDNRGSVAALTACLVELQSRSHAWDFWAVATVQEEVTLAGSITSTHQLHPTLAVAVDVTWAKGPGASDWQTTPFGKGPQITWGPNIHPALFSAIREQAALLEIPCDVEYAPRHTGTDTYAAQVTAEGIPSALVSLPLRYMHTPVEMVSLKDIQRTGRLLAGFIASLGMDFMDKISWDKEAQ